MVKVVGVSGSPRKGGNTSILVEEALKAVAGRAETQLVNLADVAPGGVLPSREALAPVVRAIEGADAVFLGTPSYFGGPSAVLKALMDETWELARAGKLEGKAGAAYTVEITSGGELAAQSLSHFFAIHRMVFMGYVVGRGYKEREVLFDIKAIRDARDLAGRVVDFVEKKR